MMMKKKSVVVMSNRSLGDNPSSSLKKVECSTQLYNSLD